MPASAAEARAWRVLLHQRLLQTIDLRRKDVRRLSSLQLRGEARAILEELIAGEPDLPAALDRARLVDECLDEVVGLGPLEPLMADPAVSEIMVNCATEIYVERAGRLQPTGMSFSSEASVRAVIERIVAPLGRRIDESSPMVDARLPDGSRVNAIIPPLAVKGSALTIRRFGRQRLQASDLPRLGSADTRMVAFLHQCVQARRNIVIAGGTGSGKTTLLNLLAGFIGDDERLVTIEDAAELALAHPNLVRLEARPANAEGRGMVGIRDLLRNALRMRPDRIIVGECRGGEALDMLQAMNTGHEGSLTTVHANSARDVLARLETMVLMAGMDLPLAAIREQIASAIQIVVQQARSPDGHRRIVEICEITGTEGARILMQPLFRWRRGAFEDCGNIPQFFERLGLPPGAFPGRLEVRP
jgi:pilus assembly protein CpaF